MSTVVQFPNVPFVDKDGNISLPWRQWLLNPQFLSIVLQNVVAVASGGTGIGSGTSGGVLGFTASDTIASSALLAAHSLMIGGGAGATPKTISAGTDGQLLVGQSSADPSWKTVSGDGTLSAAGALSVTKTGGSAFAASATTDTTNANNISSGTLPTARLGGTSATITTAKLTVGGSNGSMTFTNGLLTAQTPAT